MHKQYRLHWFIAALLASVVSLSCSDSPSSDPEDTGGGGADAGSDMAEEGDMSRFEPAPLMCEPNDSRRCECPIGVGQQNCSDAGDEWGQCLCPVKQIEFADGVIQIVPAEVGSARSEGQTLRMPKEGNEQYADVQVGDIVVWLEGLGLMGRVTGVFVEGEELAIDTELISPEEVYGSIALKLEDTALNVEGHLPEALRDEAQAPAAGSGITGFDFNGVSGFTYDVDGLSVRPMGSLQFTEFSFGSGSRWNFNPYINDIDVRFQLLPEPGLNSFVLDAGLDTSFVLQPTIGLKGTGQISLEAELIQLAQRAAGVPIVEPWEIPIGAGLSAEITINLRCIVAAEGDVTFSHELQLGIDAGARIEYDGSWDATSRATPTSSARATGLDWDATASVKCELKPRFRLRFLKVLYGYVEAGPYIKAEQEFEGRYQFQVIAGVEGTIGAGVEVELPPPSDVTITFFERTWPLFNVFTQLYTRQFSICGDGYRQKDSEQIGDFTAPITVFSREECDRGSLSDADVAGNPNAAACNDSCECTGTYAPSDESDLSQYGYEIPDFWAFGFPYNWCQNKCGNGVVDPGEFCDDGYNYDQCGRCSSTCDRIVGQCGDGIPDPQCWDFCDDQNTDECDGCTSACRPSGEVCGDGIAATQCGEVCDDGNTADGDTCAGDCSESFIGFCGDGIVNYQWDGTLDECDTAAFVGDWSWESWFCNGCAPGCKLFTNTCGDGILCGNECEPRVPGQDDIWCNNDCTPAFCGDGYVNAARGEVCEGESATCDSDCTLPECGDGVVNSFAGEECDSRGVDTWYCNADCTVPRCGDGYVNSVWGEACDDGDTDDCTVGCNSICTGPTYVGTCGDGVLNSDCGQEVCDDGFRNGDCGFCSSDCQTAPLTVCGDGVAEGCEICDDGNAVGGDGCASDCSKVEVCGDLWIDEGEVCDDGNPTLCGGPCRTDCSGFYDDVCGDGTISACETCEDTDPTNLSRDLGCTNAQPNCAACQGCSADICGDGIVGPSEACEPPGFCDGGPETATCTVNDTSQCDEPNLACRFNDFECAGGCARVVTCGDGFIDGAENCDDSNTSNADDCVEGTDPFLLGCTFAFCGDGYVRTNPANPADTEECDDGNFADGDGCSSSCTVE